MAVTLNSCDKYNINTGLFQQPEVKTLYEDANRPARPVILGKQLNNPYSIENMQAALDTLKAHPEQHSSCMKAPSATLEDITIEPTDLYVRFLPADSSQFVKLMTDTTLILFDYPLDYEKVQTGDYYKDPTVQGKFTWLYTSVPTGYQPPLGIKYEIIKELFIPEHSPYFSVQDAPSNAKGIRPIKSYVAKQANYSDVLKTMEAVSFIITGNGNQLNKPTSGNTPVGMQKITKYVVKKFLWSTWTEAVYQPDGWIKLKTPTADEGLKGVRVRMARWFTAYEFRTNEYGYYYCYNEFNQLSVCNDIEYFVYLDGQYYGNSWKLMDAIAGVACLWTTCVSLGVQNPDGYSMTFTTDSYYWGECVQNNAIYNYMKIAQSQGVSLPPANLDIATMNIQGVPNGNFTSGTPLFKNNIYVTYATAIALYLGISDNLGVPIILINGVLPDMILRYENKNFYYQLITFIAWHELTHASQVQRLINEKGYQWASDYWIANVYQQATNSLKDYNKDGKADGNPYGSKGDANWQIIALSEGWANYREWEMSKIYLIWNSFTNTRWSTAPYDPTYFEYWGFPYNFAGMFYRLNLIGCTDCNIEKSLPTYNIQSFKEKLISIYPALSSNINLIIKDYE